MKFSLPARINFRSWNATTRIAFALAMWSSTVLLGLRMFGVIDDNIELVLESRVDRCEAIAYACAKLANNGDKYGVESMLQYHVERSPEIVAAKCTVDGKTLFQSAHHNDSQWKNDSEDASLTCIRIPIWKKDAVTKIPSGFVDFTFTPPISSGLPGFLERRSILIAILATGFNLLGFMFITRRCFRALDPSKVVPDRVRSALDTLAEMVIVLDQNHRIALTNKSFTNCVGNSQSHGQHVDSLPWRMAANQTFTGLITKLLDGDSDSPTVSLQTSRGSDVRTLKPNVSSIVDEAGVLQGYLVSLDDITVLEERTNKLEITLQELQESNEQLRFLATRDPMTGCFNRRAFFEKLDVVWKSTCRYKHPLSCIMIDVDHFKSINDNFGHSVGDEVLIKVAAALQEAARETDYVCRYGGEEFCVILPHVGIDGAQIAAERFRACIADLEFSQLQVTASLGCSDATFGAPSAESLIDQSDQALYCAKENGRNRVVRFDRIVEVEMNDSAQQESQASAVRSGKPMPTSIPPTKSISNATVDKLFAADL